jgi:hypothetical protein
MESVAYGGWPNCIRLANDTVDVIATTDVGPRIIRFGFLGERNQFKEFPETMGAIGGDTWRIYGGHRLWHSPEVAGRMDTPDNDPVAVEEHADFVRLVQSTEAATGMQKEIDIALAPSGAEVQVTHRIRNTNRWTIEMAPWAISVMAEGGTSIVPLPQISPPQLLATTAIALWSYTRMDDPRWHWGGEYILLRQDSGQVEPQKVGVRATDTWIAHCNQDVLFVKTFAYDPDGVYPDFGCTVETYTSSAMLEAETLGPLVHLAPGAQVEHVEHWTLHRGVPVPRNDAQVREHILPLIPRR